MSKWNFGVIGIGVGVAAAIFGPKMFRHVKEEVTETLEARKARKEAEKAKK